MGERPGLRVAVVGAGPSGLAAARALRRLGCAVTVFEARTDVGGVWSATRHYPGIGTQNDKYTYAFTDLDAPEASALAPTGPEMRAYLEEFVRVNDLTPLLRLGTRVAEAHRVGDGWAFEAHGPNGVTQEQVDWLVVANGLTSKPYVPQLAGREEFEAAGGRVVVPSELGDGELLQDRHVVVIGWGKSAGDIATVATRTARSVTVVARRVGWKLPRTIRGVSFQRVMLSRVGEWMIWGENRSFPGRVLRKLTMWPRRWFVRRLGSAVADQQDLLRRGLLPDVPADQLDHLITEGLLEAVDDATLTVRRDRRIAALETGELGNGPRLTVRLDDGSIVPADVVVAATGYDPDLDLFAPEARQELLDENGDLALIRYIAVDGVPGLGFIGWVNAFRNPINAEMQTLWLAAHMFGVATISQRARREPMVFRIGRDAAAARGVPLLPLNGSFLTVDQWLDDVGLALSPWRRRRELFGPLMPSVYADRLAVLEQRIKRASRELDAAPDLRPA